MSDSAPSDSSGVVTDSGSLSPTPSPRRTRLRTQNFSAETALDAQATDEGLVPRLWGASVVRLSTIVAVWLGY